MHAHARTREATRNTFSSESGWCGKHRPAGRGTHTQHHHYHPTEQRACIVSATLVWRGSRAGKDATPPPRTLTAHSRGGGGGRQRATTTARRGPLATLLFCCYLVRVGADPIEEAAGERARVALGELGEVRVAAPRQGMAVPLSGLREDQILTWHTVITNLVEVGVAAPRAADPLVEVGVHVVLDANVKVGERLCWCRAGRLRSSCEGSGSFTCHVITGLGSIARARAWS